MPFLPCILCGRKLEKRIDKNGKPYFVCDPCGIQLFVRRKHGMELLEEVFRNSEKAQLPFTVHARDLYEIRALIKEIEGVKAEISKVGSFFLSDEEFRIRNALKTKLKNLLFQLDQMAKEETNKG
jgi:DNA-directed RNA polymerase subunit RPC12/RpoP